MSITNIPPEDRLITSEMISSETGLSDSTIKNMMRDGTIPCIAIGSKRMCTQQQWRDYVTALSKPAKKQPASKKEEPAVTAAPAADDVDDPF